MRVLLFGTGKYYSRYKKYAEEYEIIALVDNDEKKQGKEMDGYPVIAPCGIKDYVFDRIYICSLFYSREIRDQLSGLGILENKIFYVFDLPIRRVEPYQIYRAEKEDGSYETVIEKEDGNRAANKDETSGENRVTAKQIMMISHDLSVTGAPNCLFYAAKVYVEKGCKLTIASPNDGPMREQFLSIGADVVIDERLWMSRMKGIEWADGADLLFVNTVQMFYLLLERDLKVPVVWWIHEPEFLYQNVISDRMEDIPIENMRIYAVSEVAERAFHKICPWLRVGRLMFGLPDMGKERRTRRVRNFITVGAVCKLKGQDILLDAVSSLSVSEKETCEFWIAGKSDSKFACSLKAISEEMRLPIRFLGELSHEKMLQMEREADVLVCVSRQETVSMAVVEAMMNGTPAIVSSAAGIVEYITDGRNGMVFTSEDTEGLKEKLVYCLEHEDALERMGQEARRTYEEYFSMNGFEERLMEITGI